MKPGRLVVLSVLAFLPPSWLHAGNPLREVPAAYYRNPFRPPASKDSVLVGAFRLRERAVTVAEFLEFVKRNREWSKSGIKPLFAESFYLASWKDDTHPPGHRLADPVTEVSWYAAKSYCSSLGERLPTTDEWERVATQAPPGRDSAAFTERILEWYSHPAGKGRVPAKGSQDAYGIHDLHGRIWEWTSDYNTQSLSQGSLSDKDGTFFCGAAGQATALGAGYATFMRFSFRSSLKPAFAVGSLGFRCAQGGME